MPVSTWCRDVFSVLQPAAPAETHSTKAVQVNTQPPSTMFAFSQSSISPMPQSPAFFLGANTQVRETAAAKDALQQTVLYSSAGLDIAYNRLHQYMYCNWKGAHTPESLRAGTEVLLTLLKTQACDRVLMDNRGVKGAYGAASRWVKLGLLAALQTYGLARVSWLVSSDPLLHFANALSLRQVSEEGSFVRSFSDENAAKLWLLERLNRRRTTDPGYY